MRQKQISNLMIKTGARSARYAGLAILLSAILLSACIPGLNPQVNPTAVQSTAGVPVSGAGPSVTVNDQDTSQDTVVVADVVSSGPGWIVIHNQENGALGPAIGYAPVKDGDNRNVTVKLDPTKITPTMFAMLHTDAGTVGKYEFPGPDVPVMANGQMLAPEFQAVQHTANIVPAVVVHNQVVTNGQVSIDAVTSAGPGWIAIHTEDASGNPGPEIGYTAVQPGQNGSLTVIVDQSRVTPRMYAMLHSDQGDVGSYEYPGPDMPEMANGQMVAPSFLTTTTAETTPAGVAQATLAVNPPALSPSVTGSAAAVSPTEMAGMAAVTTAPTTTATPTAVALTATTAATTGVSMSGNVPSITVVDQAPSGSSVLVPKVYLTEDAWLVIHKQDPDGKMGEFIGYVRLKKGESDNVKVKIDPKLATPVLYAMLHDDFGTIGKLEFPGPDVPVMVNGAMINPSFRYSAEAAAATPSPSAASGFTTTATAGVPATGSSAAPAGGSVIINAAASPNTPIHLVDGRGMSLYLYLNDLPGQSKCTGDCQAVWKPLLASGKLTAGNGVQASKLGVLLQPDGTRQVTYSGAPLYLYTQDVNPGDTHGQGIDGSWFLVTP